MSIKGATLPAQYCFAQQRDSSCHLMPFINLEILNTLRATVGKVDLDLNQSGSWHTKREWLPETFKYTKSWQKAMTSLYDAEGPFFQRQQRQLRDGVLNGHIYRADGVRVDDTWNPITNYANMMLYPYNFTDANTLPTELAWEHYFQAFKTLPLFWNDGKALCFDEEQNDYIALEEVDEKADWDIALAISHGTSMSNILSTTTQPEASQSSPSTSASVSAQQSIYARAHNLAEDYWSSIEENYDRFFPASASKENDQNFDFDLQKNTSHSSATHRYFKLSPSQKLLLDLPEKTVLSISNPSVLGFEMAFKYRYLPVESQKHSYYMSSLCQLILFAMGLDSKNEPINEAHPDYEAFMELKAAMSQEKENPWNLPSFSKENFVEYHITEMIKADPFLKKKMEDTVSIFFPAWEKYKELDSLYDENHVPLKDRKKALMGEEQYLAYCYVQSARFLWAASISRQAFNAILEIDPNLAHLLRLPLTPGPNQVMRNAQVKINGNSFLDVWKEIQANLIATPNIPKDLASFSGHGIVMSLHNDLFEAQMYSGVQNPQIMNQLGFSVIDSYYGDQLQPMYRRESDHLAARSSCSIEKMTSEPEALLSLSTSKSYSIRQQTALTTLASDPLDTKEEKKPKSRKKRGG